jgi:hypothetical protein
VDDTIFDNSVLAAEVEAMATRKKDTETSSAGAAKCRRKFLRFFHEGFRDETYIAWERGYKWKRIYAGAKR